MGNQDTTEWEERTRPRFVRFKSGDVVEGVLVRIERIRVGGKPVLRYTVKDDDGQLSSFLGTYQINEKLQIGDRGRRIQVECVGDDQTVVRSGRSMRVFRVKVSRHVVDELAARGSMCSVHAARVVREGTRSGLSALRPDIQCHE